MALNILCAPRFMTADHGSLNEPSQSSHFINEELGALPSYSLVQGHKTHYTESE